MSETEDLIQQVGQAKAYIDNGLCRVGPGLKPEVKMDALLTGGASRSLALVDAVVELCRRDHPTEALVVLRQLVETIVSMRWAVVQEESEGRAGEVLKAWEGAHWDSLWSEGRLKARAQEASISEADVEGILSHAVDFVRGNSTGAPWSHIFKENQRPAAETRAVLLLAVRWMGHCIRALDIRWPESFPGAEAMWEHS